MSGASGKISNAVHLIPESVRGGLIAKLQDGDRLRLDCEAGVLSYIGDQVGLMPAIRLSSVPTAQIQAWAARCLP